MTQLAIAGCPSSRMMNDSTDPAATTTKTWDMTLLSVSSYRTKSTSWTYAKQQQNTTIHDLQERLTCLTSSTASWSMGTMCMSWACVAPDLVSMATEPESLEDETYDRMKEGHDEWHRTYTMVGHELQIPGWALSDIQAVTGLWKNAMHTGRSSCRGPSSCDETRR
jgi:hypothetical protein